jgi:hypothetical protein
MKAVAERFVRTIKDECQSKMVFFGEGMQRRAIAEFVERPREARPPWAQPSKPRRPACTARRTLRG